MKIMITGATSGIGKQLASDYLQDGHTVIACGRSLEKLQALEAQLTQETNRSRFSVLAFDVSDLQQTQKALSQVSELDCVILNAGVCEYIDDLSEFEAELFERVFAANFMGLVNCIDGLRSVLRKGDRLVLVDSMARLLPFTRAEAYGASKAAAHYLGNVLKIDLAKKGIAVTTVSPGFVETPMTDANDFEMPMRITVEDASKAIRKGIEKGKQQIYFPSVFGWILRFLGKLPLRVQLAISRRMSKG
ncbi:MAG: putative short-chain dehydrogenase [Idiomarinaceae bacterium HL-53]|nr:MAG: putative short-chain dehydrogenase [Idiomarinaceae bacterium HL-53]CUS48898.1 Short-chain dehydrogenase [Idiomarinaceae bacterium HL-53]